MPHGSARPGGDRLSNLERAVRFEHDHRVRFLMVKAAQIELLTPNVHIEVAVASLVGSTDHVVARSPSRRTELEVRVALGDRSGLKITALGSPTSA